MASERRTSGIVTPEAVLLEFETGGVASRGLARLIDVSIQGFVFFTVAGALVTVVGVVTDDPGLTVAAALLVVFGVVFGYPIACETLWSGRTLGKAALGLRVLTSDGAPIRLRQATIRAVVGFIEVFALPFISVLSTAMSPANQRVGDLTAGTIVVRERSAARSAIALAFPPPHGWEDYARSLDVSVMSAEQYRIVRSFLTRVLALTPEARVRLATRLANPLALAMRHQPPAQLGPELFLVCVASAYQARNAALAAPVVQPA